MPLTESPLESPPDAATEPGQLAPLEHHEPAPLPARIVVGRHGELETHELIRLLDTIEDERARGRFRESLYISLFVWIAIAWFFTYGLHMIYHPAQLKETELHEKELTNLSMPTIRPAPVPVVHPTIDNETMARLHEMTRRAAAEAPRAAAPQPTPTPAATPPPPPPPPVANTPQPHTPPPVVADAPTMQPPKSAFQGSPAFSRDSRALGEAPRPGGGDYGTARPGRHTGPQNLGGVQVLSDTQGVDFDPYIRRLLSDVKRNWEPLLPIEAGPPLYKQGETYISFSINPDGTIASGSMHLDGSTHDEPIDRSCWGAITSEGQFPPLPSQFHGPNLTLRIHFYTNREPSE